MMFGAALFGYSLSTDAHSAIDKFQTKCFEIQCTWQVSDKMFWNSYKKDDFLDSIISDTALPADFR